MRSAELTAAALEAQLRANLAARGEKPAGWLVDEIRSGEWQRRQRRNQRAIQASMMQTATARRDVQRTAPVVVRRISATPRPGARTAGRTSGSRGDPPPDDDAGEHDLVHISELVRELFDEIERWAAA
jgi:hypothetical protein